MKAGKYLALRNAKVDMYRGTMRLVVDALGKVEEAEAKFEPKVRLRASRGGRSGCCARGQCAAGWLLHCIGCIS